LLSQHNVEIIVNIMT